MSKRNLKSSRNNARPMFLPLEGQKVKMNVLTREILHMIFKFVEEPDYFQLLFVSKVFREVANSDAMWRWQYCTRWNVSADVTQISLIDFIIYGEVIFIGNTD